ncbi:MAG: hypothetical protein OHK0023_18440 [Anaerolineae bacterium]
MLPTIALLIALVGYYVTWINNAAAALSANAFDLAEWVGIAPSVRYVAPPNVPMLPPLLLRLALVILALLFALHAARAQKITPRVIFSLIALALVVSLRPPIDFFRGNSTDPNYQQLAGLCALGLVGLALLAAAAWRGLRLGWLTLPLTLIGILAALVGYLQSVEVIRTLQIPAPLGAGLPLYCGGLTIHTLTIFIHAARGQAFINQEKHKLF